MKRSDLKPCGGVIPPPPAIRKCNDLKSCGGVTSPFPHSILRFNLTDNVRVRTYPHGPCRPKPLPVPAARSFPNIFSLPDDDRRGKKVGNDFGRDQNTHINTLMVLVSTRPSSSGPGHHHRDDKHGSYLLRSTHALIVFRTQRSLVAK